MQTICIKTKIKAEDIEEVRTWFKTLLNRRGEVLETLKIEGVVVESAFLDKQGRDFFLIYYVKAKNIDDVYKKFDNSILPIDLYFKNCWKKYCHGRVVLECLLDLERL